MSNCKKCDVRVNIAKAVTGESFVNGMCKGCQEAEKANCNYCIKSKESGDTMMPPHFASRRCQSGNHNHCTCDACY